jgi:hypothetical protein
MKFSTYLLAFQLLTLVSSMPDPSKSKHKAKKPSIDDAPRKILVKKMMAEEPHDGFHNTIVPYNTRNPDYAPESMISSSTSTDENSTTTNSTSSSSRAGATLVSSNMPMVAVLLSAMALL